MGRAQAKVFAVCVKTESETVGNHHHDLVVGGAMSETHPLPTGRTDITMTCAPGQTPIQPGYLLDGTAPVVTTYPDSVNSWRFGVVNDGAATTGTFTMRCLDNLVSTANGHTHQLGLDEIRRTVTVPAGQVAEFTLTCADDAKGIVAGYDIDPGLVVLGNDPRPIIRVFKLYNPTNAPLSAKLYLLCLKNRTEKGADQGGTDHEHRDRHDVDPGDRERRQQLQRHRPGRHVAAGRPGGPADRLRLDRGRDRQVRRRRRHLQGCGHAGRGVDDEARRPDHQGRHRAGQGRLQDQVRQEGDAAPEEDRARQEGRSASKAVKKAKLKIGGDVRTVRLKH